MRMDPKALEVKVIGQQWSWRFEYPEQEITTTELVLPVDKQVLLRLTSEDVIHSFWVPEFRVKQDAIPGSYRELRVTPNEIGEFQMVCSEMCGQQHAYMTAPVRVMGQEDFDAWVASVQIPTDPVGRGEYWYRTQGCAACHSLDGSKIVGPSFQGLYGHAVQLIDGTSVVADDAYIKESILNPYVKIVDGFELSPGSGTSAMPATYADTLTDEQIQDIIEFLKTLE
jgi:cytochrome c oxidase subunit 2